MLVLSRNCSESICIGDDVIVTVVDVRNGRVRIGIQAPPDTKVHRREVYDAIKEGVPHKSTIRTVKGKRTKSADSSSA